MDSALLVHRLHFAFTVTFHYLFPQLTMGLAPLIVVLKTLALAAAIRIRDLRSGRALLGEHLRHQFRAWRCDWHSHGISVRHQLVALFAFRRRRHRPDAGHGRHVRFLSRVGIPGIISLRRKTAEPARHWWSAVAVFLGSWLSGYFIIATDAWMQHPVGYFMAADGSLQLASFWDFVLNPWACWQYAHNMSGAAITGAFRHGVGRRVLSALATSTTSMARIFVKVRRDRRLRRSASCNFFPPATGKASMVTQNQPVTLAAMEGLFHSQPGAPLVIIGQPDDAAAQQSTTRSQFRRCSAF